MSIVGAFVFGYVLATLTWFGLGLIGRRRPDGKGQRPRPRAYIVTVDGKVHEHVAREVEREVKRAHMGWPLPWPPPPPAEKPLPAPTAEPMRP